MRKLALLIFFLITLQSFAQLQAFRNRDEHAYNFWLDIPIEYQKSDTVVPAIVFLHGRSLSGNNLESVKRYGVLNEVIKRRRVPALVVAPQCPAGQQWNPDKVMKLISYLKQNFRVDTNRIYLTGMSMGGYGVLHFTGKYPGQVAAAVALCGGGKTEDSLALSSRPIWIMHGRQDRAVSYLESEKIVNSIRNVNGGQNLKYSLYPSLGHRELARFFMMDELYDWIFSYSLAHPGGITDSLAVSEKRFRSRSVRMINGDLVDDSLEGYIRLPGQVHLIQKGDTLWHLSKKYGVSVEKLCEINRISKDTTLRIGMEIVIP